jgi:RimJ/RimL family protein N-acetyltransferase
MADDSPGYARSLSSHRRLSESIPPEIRTLRLLLRAWRPEDAVRLEPILIGNADHLGPWIPASVATPAGLPELAERLARYAADFAASRAWRFAMFSAADDELLGEIDLFPRNASGRVVLADADRAEVGYWLRRDRVMEGFATEGVQAVLAVAAECERFAHAEIRCHPRNVRSAALPARLGFSLAVRDAEDAEDAGASAHTDTLSIWMLPLPGAS